MDQSFAEWVQEEDARPRCIREHANALIRLGTSWDSFRPLLVEAMTTSSDSSSSGQQQQQQDLLLQDLVDTGRIPLLAARDICRVVRLEWEHRQAPLAVFWDLQSMPVLPPTTATATAAGLAARTTRSSSVREITARLKAVVEPFGRLVQFKGYNGSTDNSNNNNNNHNNSDAQVTHRIKQKQTRSELQLAGCQLIDCPDSGNSTDENTIRSAAAATIDAMMIVDALQFALSIKGDSDRSTVCLITDRFSSADPTANYSLQYALAALQQNSACRIMVISKDGNDPSDCYARKSWNKDIMVPVRPAFTFLEEKTVLSKSSNSSNEEGPSKVSNKTKNQEGENGDEGGDIVTATSWSSTEHGTVKLKRLSASSSPPVTPASAAPSPSNNGSQNTSHDSGETPKKANGSRMPLRKESEGKPKEPEPLSSSTMMMMDLDGWDEDVGLLRSLLHSHGNKGVGFKHTIGSLLKTANPNRFGNRFAVHTFLTSAVEAGIVVEFGEGHYKEIALPVPPSENSDSTSATSVVNNKNDTGDSPKNIQLPITKIIPLEMLQSVPERVIHVSAKRPYLLFVPKLFFSGRVPKPKGAFIKESRGRWLILMFVSLADVHKAITDIPQLLDGGNDSTIIAGGRNSNGNCTLVDWRECKSLDAGDICGSCCKCQKELLESEIVYTSPVCSANSNKKFEEYAYCAKCYEWNDQDGERKKAVERVVAMLTMMAEHDDIYVARKFLKKQLYLRYTETGIITTHKHAELWIDEAIRVDEVAPFKKDGSKKILVCLTSHLQLANDDRVTAAPLETSKEEKFVEDLLLLHAASSARNQSKEQQASHGWISRKDVNERLELTFPRMCTPFMRAKVFQNAASMKKFGIARGPFGQTVGATEQDAQDSLERMNKLRKEELEWNLINGATNLSSGGSLGPGESLPPLPPPLSTWKDPSDVVRRGNQESESLAQNIAQQTSAVHLGASSVKGVAISGDTVDCNTAILCNDEEGEDDEKSGSEGILSEWDDAESMDSADIDALLFNRSNTV